MADKEERILIEKVWICEKPKNKDMYKCDCIESPNDMAGLQVCPIHPQIASKEGISKSEAVEVMAKAIRSWEFPYSPRQIGWEDLSEDTKDDYKNMAGAALNALLEGGK